MSIRLRVRAERMHLSAAEREGGVRLVAWSNVTRADPGPSAEATVLRDGLPEGTKGHSPTMEMDVPLPHGRGTLPADANAWFRAHIFAKSEEGPLVGSRGGSGGVFLERLVERLVHKKKSVIIPLVMSQPGGPRDKPYTKLKVRIMGFADDESRARAEAWRFERAQRFDFVPANMDLHDRLLGDYLNVLLYPFTDDADAAGLYFAPTVRAIEPVHAPIYLSNLPVPQFMFWVQTGMPVFDGAMEGFMGDVTEAALSRHGWATDDFVRTVNRQFEQTDDTYDDRFTYAVATTMDACALLAVSTFYRFDEEWRVKEGIFGCTTEKKYDVESFHDALAMGGGDCEDQASLIHRVLRWMQLGNPANRNPALYWRRFGGWANLVLDAMQHILYWYVSGGSLGSVTAARYTPTAGETKDLVIDSVSDKKLQMGGHMWQESMSVYKAEELMRRMNPDNVPSGTLRPDYVRRVGAYPPWLYRVPHTVGEGTGAVYPLVLPLATYMHDATAKARAEAWHERVIKAMDLMHEHTNVLKQLQIERFSDRTATVKDARVNFFYRRAVKMSTDDFLLHANLPRFDVYWTRTAPRGADEEPEEMSPHIHAPVVTASVPIGAPSPTKNFAAIGREIKDRHAHFRWPDVIAEARPTEVRAFWAMLSKFLSTQIELEDRNEDPTKACRRRGHPKKVYVVMEAVDEEADEDDDPLNFNDQWMLMLNEGEGYVRASFGNLGRATYDVQNGRMHRVYQGHYNKKTHEKRFFSHRTPKAMLNVVDAILEQLDEDDEFLTMRDFLDDLGKSNTYASYLYRARASEKGQKLVKAVPVRAFYEPGLGVFARWVIVDAPVEPKQDLKGFLTMLQTFLERREATGDRDTLIEEGVLLDPHVVMEYETIEDANEQRVTHGIVDSFYISLDSGPPSSATVHFGNHTLDLVQDTIAPIREFEDILFKAQTQGSIISMDDDLMEEFISAMVEVADRNQLKARTPRDDDDEDDLDEVYGRYTLRERNASYTKPARALIGAHDRASREAKPTFGASMRDRLLAVNESAGISKPHVALTVAPPVTPDELRSFRTRMRQLRPWQQPRRRAEDLNRITGIFAPVIDTFRKDVMRHGITTGFTTGSGPGGGNSTVQVNIIFRRQLFLMPYIRATALDDLRALEATGKLDSVNVAFEFFDEGIFNVRLALWLTV